MKKKNQISTTLMLLTTTCKIILIIAFITTISLTASSQSTPQNLHLGFPIQTYSGAIDENTTATYQYYENDQYERVYQGDFKAVCSRNWTIVTLTGKFSEDKKDGAWKVTSDIGNVFLGKYSEIVKGNYVNGNMEGTWTYQVISKETGKIESQSTANFKNNLQIGAYEFTLGEENIIKYRLNDEGFIDGEYTADFTDSDKVKWQHRAKFENGIMYFSLYRNLSTGEIIEKSNEAVNYTPVRFDGNYYYVKYNYLKFIPLNCWNAESSAHCVGRFANNSGFSSIPYEFIKFDKGSTVPQQKLMR